MYISHLSLTNFRNYGRLELDFKTGPVLLYGHNAQGKTNLLEAIYYLATTRSPHADTDQQLLNWNANESDEPIVVGRLVAQVVTSDGSKLLELRLIKEQKLRNGPTFRREALVNRRQVRLMDLIGHLRATLFLPEDIQLITGPPANRRRYVDITLCQVDPTYCRNLSSYNKVLEQRNALLRQINESGSGRDVLPIFTDKLITLGSYIFAQRAALFAHLGHTAQRIHYEDLTNRQETIRLNYLPRLQETQAGRSREENEAVTEMMALADWLHEQPAGNHKAIAARFREAVDGCVDQDIARSSTTLGPHRDDWFFQVNGRPLSSYGSRGQQRSAMLALKLAEIAWMKAETGETPILLLDEVVAELDERRRALLLQVTQNASQAILTTTDPGMFPPGFLQGAQTLRVDKGRVASDVPFAAAAEP